MGNIYIIAVVLMGLCIGSFLNVCIYRIPTGESIVSGRSHCTACGTIIRPYDLIPVFSYLILRGRCRACGQKISIRYPLVELLNAVLYLLLFFCFRLTPAFFLYSAFMSALIVSSAIDMNTTMIPDRMHVVIIVIGILACFFSPDVIWYERIIGFFAASVPLFIAMLASRGGMGFGDVKLMAAAGLMLGWKLILFSLFTASVVGAIFGIALILTKGKTMKTAITFGPFLAFGCFFALLFGNTLISAYLHLFLK
jgi:leader peptidase (prepilin peptidase) / N-methyltransferase